jgi:hypothetical protein
MRDVIAAFIGTPEARDHPAPSHSAHRGVPGHHRTGDISTMRPTASWPACSRGRPVLARTSRSRGSHMKFGASKTRFSVEFPTYGNTADGRGTAPAKAGAAIKFETQSREQRLGWSMRSGRAPGKAGRHRLAPFVIEPAITPLPSR